MKYSITVPEMHCNGCDGLMQVTLEDDFQNVKANHLKHIVVFESEESIESVRVKLSKLFEEFSEKEPYYTFTNLKYE